MVGRIYTLGINIYDVYGNFLALLGLVGKMYSKIQSCWRASGKNHKDTKDTKIDRSYTYIS